MGSESSSFWLSTSKPLPPLWLSIPLAASIVFIREVVVGGSLHAIAAGALLNHFECRLLSATACALRSRVVLTTARTVSRDLSRLTSDWSLGKTPTDHAHSSVAVLCSEPQVEYQLFSAKSTEYFCHALE